MDAVVAVRRAREQCEALVEWRKHKEQGRREARRAQYADKRIRLGGGLRQVKRVEPLCELTGVEVHWVERYRDEDEDLSRFGQRIWAGTYACVVYLYEKSGHEVEDQLKETCERVGVPFRPAASAEGGWWGDRRTGQPTNELSVLIRLNQSPSRRAALCSFPYADKGSTCCE